MPRVSADRREQYLQSRREQILDAAVKVFGKKGFAGANVADVAEAAGIGKGTVYLYFKSKEDIFSAILEERSFIPYLAHITTNDQISLEAALTEIATEYIRRAVDYLPILRMTIMEAGRFPDHAEQVYRNIVHRGSEILAAFLTAQMQAGKIRQLENPFLTARAFMAMITTYVLTQELLGGRQVDPIAQEDWVCEVVQVYLRGIEV